jgi:hypothetical protein
VSFSDEERADWIGALIKTAEMVEILLNQLDLLLLAYEAGRPLTDAEAQKLKDASALWRQQLEKLRHRLASVTIEPPSRVQ